MAYIQITTRCNMTCEHCCMSATAKGEDMSLEVFKAALGLDEYPAIGGGEPTLHPMFWEFMGLAMGTAEHVWLATNGSRADTALALAGLAKKGAIGCALSIDPWHDPIDPRVEDAFRKGSKVRGENSNDCREIRDVSGKVVAAGRAKANEIHDREDCPCPDFQIRPNGDIYGCGCDDAPLLGNILDDWQVPEDWEWGECYKDQSEWKAA